MNIKYSNIYIKKFFLCIFFFSSFFLQGAVPQAPQEMPSPEELQAMVEDIEKNDPELFKLLQEEGRRILQEAGIDPDSFEQQKPGPIKEEIKTPIPVPEKIKNPSAVTEPKAEIKSAVRGVKEIEYLLQSLIESLQRMRLKTHANTSIARLLERFKRELDDLFYYLPIIKNKPIISYLTTSDYTSLYMRLKSFTYKIVELEQQLIINDLYTEKHNTPYHILTLRPGSSLEEIKGSYKRKMQTKNPEELKKKLKKEGFSAKEQEAILQDNALQRRAIQEAYDLLMDINTKKRFDREHEFTASQKLSGGTVSKELLSSIGKAFTDFMYNERSLEDIKKLIAQYDPEAAKLKIKMEEDIKQERQRIEEAKKRPQQPSPRAPYSPRSSYPEAYNNPYGDSYGGGGGYIPDYSSHYPSYSSAAENARPSSNKSTDAGSGRSEVKDKDKDKKDKDDKEDKDNKKTRSKNSKQKDLKTYIKECVKPLRKTAHSLTNPALNDIKDADKIKAKKIYDSLELDTLIEKLSGLSDFLMDDKNKEQIDKEKKEVAQEWKITVLVPSQAILKKIELLLAEEEEKEETISYQEILARDFDNLRTRLQDISKSLSLKSDALLKPIFEILKKPARTDIFNGLLIDVQKQINKETKADLELLKKNLTDIFSQIGSLDKDKKDLQKTAWGNKIVKGALPFVQKLAALREEKESAMNLEETEESDLVHTIFRLFKAICENYTIDEEEYRDFLTIVSKDREF